MVLSLETPIISEVKAKTTNYGVVVIGRNEEHGIANCLQSIVGQTLKPDKIIFVNDGSTDKTKEIADCYPEVEVMEFPEEHETWVDSENLSRIVNQGILKVGMLKELNFIITMGGDTILPKNYADQIITKMVKHPEIVIASGKINKERTHIPRGTARITNLNYWKKIGLGYKVRIGFEGYHVFKAASMGLSHKVFDDIVIKSDYTGSNYTNKHWFNEGMSAKALGYTRTYLLGRAFLMFFRGKRRGSFSLINGYNKNKSIFYEKEVREYVEINQKRLIKQRLKDLIVKTITPILFIHFIISLSKYDNED